MPEKVLVVEDEAALRDTLEYNLRKHGYEVLTASDGWEALRKARTTHPDLIILDILLPGIDGFEVCRLLRQDMDVPILMLTAKAEEVDKVVGLEMGADDYVTKPFSMRELLARVKALLRRVRLDRAAAERARQGQERMVFGDLIIDVPRREVLLRGKPLRLKPKEFDLLVFLARHRGIVLSRNLILERVWGWDFDGGTRTVDVHIRWLREKIEPDPSHPQRIITVRGVGYRFDG